MKEFAIRKITTEELNALAKNIMFRMGIDDPKEAIRRVNSGEWRITKSVNCWYEEDGVIYLSITSNGLTGPEWLRCLQSGSYSLTYGEAQILESQEFLATKGVRSEIAILKWPFDRKPSLKTKDVRAEAHRRKLLEPNLEDVCLLRVKLSDDDIAAMGLRIIAVMHKGSKAFLNKPMVLGVARETNQGPGPSLLTLDADPKHGWADETGFAFTISRIPLLES